jgi:pimeloyl-ACP methyl ester carboxylesterase/DNA-binding SARP family transcriptional activator
MIVRVLGSLEIASVAGMAHSPHGARQRLLLGTLALHAPRIVAADRLIDMLWGDRLPAEPGAALRSQVARLRALLARVGEADRLRRGHASGYGLSLATEELDAGVFETLVRRAAEAGDAAAGLALAEQALALWRDEPYVELHDTPHFAGEAARLGELWMLAHERRVQCMLALDRTGEAFVAASALVERDPLRERSRALVMEALYRAGRQHEALASFQEYRRLLAEELGLTPSPSLRALETQIVQHAPAALRPAHARGDAVDAVDAPATAGPAAIPAQAAHPQDIRFTRSTDGVRLAYATVGNGPPLVKAANWLNHLEFDWESPVWRRLFREIAARRTLIRYDERGSGLSDHDPAEMSLDAWVLDLESIVDACGLERFPLLGISQGCAVCIEYAARHPERVSALILHGGYAAGWRVDPSFGASEIARRDASIEIVRHGWGEDTPAYRQMFTLTFIPGGTADEVAWFNELQRRTATPENAARFMEAFAYIDVRHRLAGIRAPTLVLHSRGDQRISFEKGRELATAIPGARFVPLESSNHLVLEHEPAFGTWVGEMLRFLDDTAAGAGGDALHGRVTPSV